MKIVVVTQEFGDDGGGLAFSCLRIKNMLEKNHVVIVISSCDYPINVVEGGYNKIITQGIRNEAKLKQDACAVADADVVIGFGGGYNGYYASLLAKKIKARFVLSLRGSDINISKWDIQNSWYAMQSAKYADHIVCLSGEMRDNLLSINPCCCNKISVIPIAIESEIQPIHFPNLPNSLVIGCTAAHLNEKKGVGNLLYMLNEFKKLTSMPIRMELVGAVDEDLQENYNQLASVLDVDANVRFYGKINRSNLAQIMESWDFYIQGSVCEGFSNSVIEAIKSGKAYICTKTGYIAEMLSDEFPAIVFKSLMPDKMASKLLTLVGRNDKVSLYSAANKILIKKCEESVVENLWKSVLQSTTISKSQINLNDIISICLHDVSGDTHDSINTPIGVFESFVNYVYKSGLGLCSMKDYLSKNDTERKKLIVCTFDDGYTNLESIVLPILSKYNFTATVFVCTDLIGLNNDWNNKDAVCRNHLTIKQLHSLNNNGWEIASHGLTHRNMLRLNDLEVEEELCESKQFLFNEFGYAQTYAYPYGAYNDFIKKCVKKHYEHAFATISGGTSLIIDKYQIRRYSISDIYKLISKI